MKIEITKKLSDDQTCKVGDYTTTEELEENGIISEYEYKPLVYPDWTGNTQSVMATLNASSHSKWERQTHDYYATPPNAVIQLLQKEKFATNILEPACGEWHISQTLELVGHKVLSSDLINRGYGEQRDFLWPDFMDSWHGDIITNPPFSMVTEFLEKGMSIIRDNQKFAMLLRIQFLEWVKRNEVFKRYPPKTIYVFSRNIRCAKNWDFANATGNASTYCWFVWEKGYKGKPSIDWII